MIEVEFYCDESGEFGYSDKPERNRGDFALVAGLIIDCSNKSKVDGFCRDLYGRYGKYGRGGKFHIADIGQNRDPLRREVFEFLKSEKIPLAYGAVYLQPLNFEFLKQEEMLADSDLRLRKEGIRLSANSSMFKKSSQAEAFFVFYTKAMVCSVQVFGQPVCGLVKTDNIDGVLKKRYQEAIKRTHSRKSHKPLKFRHFDPESTEKSEHFVSVEVSCEDSVFSMINDSFGKVCIVGKDDSILADVLSNSLGNHLKNYVRESGCGPLNNFMAIKDFELSENFVAKNTGEIDIWLPYSSC